MKRPLLKTSARVVLTALAWNIVAPLGQAYALTGGPSQPEFSSFEPVTTSNMVDPLTGQFSYNLPVVSIPGPNGGGYALSLSYHSGVSPEQEASWVGSGWTLNPGAITRAKRGFPDEYNGEKVRYWNKTDPNETITASFGASPEIFSQTPFSGGNLTLRYNSYKGYGFVAGVSKDIKGLGSVGLSVSDDGVNFSADLSVAEILNGISFNRNGVEDPAEASDNIASSMHQWATEGMRLYNRIKEFPYVQYSVANDNRPTHFQPYTGASTNIKVGILGPLSFIPAGSSIEVNGSYTSQRNVPLVETPAYGYMYSGNAGDDAMMDYYVEKQAPFNKRDAFLGIPFNNADYFNVSGEGLGGGFRLYNKKPGQFHPNKIHSEITSVNVEAQVHIGANLGLGTKLSGGKQFLDIEPWLDGDGAWKHATEKEGDEPYFFRMNNDLGGSVTYNPFGDVSPADDDDAFRAGFDLLGDGPEIGNGDVGAMNEGKRSGRSSHIAYSTVRELKQVRGLGIRRSDLSLLEDNDFSSYYYLDQLPESAIGEIAVTNPAGSRYTYGLPVIARDEKQLQYGLHKAAHSSVVDGAVTAALTPEYAAVVVGEESPTPYVSEYLLTSVLSPDYVDRTHDGLSDDDFGGWVRFSYYPTTGHWYNSDAGYYKWRIPYKGLSYNRNSLSDEKDDMGTVSMGRKGIFYLTSIETKSHVAFFHTNGYSADPKRSIVAAHGGMIPRQWRWLTGLDENDNIHIRKDAYPAALDEKSAANGASATTSGGNQAYNPMRRLEKIELWSKDGKGNPDQKLQTVHFEYDYSLCKGLPNAYGGVGKLTLKRVYFEYNGVVNAKISPYVFGYEYRKGTDYDRLPPEVKAMYQPIINYAADLDDDSETGGAESDQNPNYKQYHIGRWGYYRYDGAYRAANMIPWDDQKPDPAEFDPGAWNLKWIRLPSGGEIHVQYEQNEYGYVQDQPAMMMARLSEVDVPTRRLFFDLNAILGIDINAGSLQDQARARAIRDGIRNAMYERFKTGGEKIYFKVLHSLTGNGSQFGPDVVNLKENVEYLSGYAPVADVGYVDVNNSNVLYVELVNGSYSTPGELAQEFIDKTRGKMNAGHKMDISGNAEGNVRVLVSALDFLLNPFDLNTIGDDDAEIDVNRSWVRIPLGTQETNFIPKKGGGIRVKRLLMYDPGLEDGEGHLFGTEYRYTTEQGYTSGVAANEPAEGRDESALVRPLDKRNDQGWLEQIMAGEDREEFEGPIGESLLPGPSVVYSRVVEKKIYEGKTNAGFTIHEYYTARDFPSQCIYGKSQVDDKRVTEIETSDPPPIFLPTPFLNLNIVSRKALQGYGFIMNGMHGQIRKVATYGGDYDAGPEDWVESSAQEYEYYAPGEKIPVLTKYSTLPSEFEYRDLGKEMDISFEGRALTDISVDIQGHIDASISFVAGLPPFIIFVSGGGNISYSEDKLKTHVSCKVVRYPVVVRKIASRQDGVESVTENIAFNPLTGDPVVTQTTDGYDGENLQLSNGVGGGNHDRVVRTFSYPAAGEYIEMGPKASNEGRKLVSNSDMTISKLYGNGKHYLSVKFHAPSAVCDVGDLFTPGDLIRLELVDLNGDVIPVVRLGDFHVERVAGSRVLLQPFSKTVAAREFDPGGSGNLSVTILKSGKTNQLTTPRGGISTYTSRAGL